MRWGEKVFNPVYLILINEKIHYSREIFPNEDDRDEHCGK